VGESGRRAGIDPNPHQLLAFEVEQLATEAALRACANGLLDEATDLEVRIDGRLLTHPAAYRVESPLFRYGPLTAENFLGLPPATQSDALGAGYALLLPPFSKGLHRIAVRASVPAFGIAVDHLLHHETPERLARGRAQT
jgi:hypothetical protein